MKNQINLLIAVVIFAGTVFANPIEDKEILTPTEEGRWTSEIVANHEVWNRPACVAYIDNDEGATLEVISFYSENADAWTQPMVHVVTPIGISFLNMTIKVVGKKPVYEALEVLSEDGEMVAGRTTFMEPAVGNAMIRDMRNKDRVRVSYDDAVGEVQTMEFRLNGSSAALNAQFKECELKFSEVPTPVKLEEIQ